MKVDFKFLSDVLYFLEESDMPRVHFDKLAEHFNYGKLKLHLKWFEGCFYKEDDNYAISLRGISVKHFLDVAPDEILESVEPEGLYDLVNFWLIKKAEVLVNKLQDSEGVLN